VQIAIILLNPNINKSLIILIINELFVCLFAKVFVFIFGAGGFGVHHKSKGVDLSRFLGLAVDYQQKIFP